MLRWKKENLLEIKNVECYLNQALINIMAFKCTVIKGICKKQIKSLTAVNEIK